MAMVNVNNERILRLDEAKNHLLCTIDPNITRANVRLFNHNSTSFYESDLVYLHLLIIFKSPNHVENFLQDYCNVHGFYTTQMFINHPLLDIENNMNVSALDCALLWSTDPHMVRSLYRWGADTSIPNVHGRYIGDSELVPYRNYLSRYVLIENVDVTNYPPLRGRRNNNEFVRVIDESRIISGERVPPTGWIMPERIPTPHGYHPIAVNQN